MTGTSQLPLELPHLDSLRRQDFFVSDSNRLAAGIVDLWPEWPEFAQLIIGPPASGKTHLASIWAERSDATIFDGSVPAITKVAGPVVIDDAHCIQDAEAFFHLFNWCRDNAYALLLTANCRPADWPAAGLADLISRLNTVPRVNMDAPDDALLAAVLSKQFADRQLEVADNVIEYLLPRMERSLLSSRALVEALDRASLAEKVRITRHLAREVLKASGVEA